MIGYIPFAKCLEVLAKAAELVVEASGHRVSVDTWHSGVGVEIWVGGATHTYALAC